MGYKNDQFYDGTNSGENYGQPITEDGINRIRENWYHQDADNPRHIYPDRTVRTWEPVDTDHYGREGGPTHTTRRFQMEETLLKRGYVRAVARNEAYRAAKCQFQFNPQNITQNVAMQDGVYNFYMQPPGQFAQPLAGSTNMSLTLFFDRSMEINNQPTYQLVGGTGRSISPADNRPNSTSAPDTTTNSSNPWESGAPSEVGVLRDIAALYKVIGQGVSTDDIAGRKNEITSYITAEQLGEDDPNQEDFDKAVAGIENMMEINVGNYALLIPRPVRFVFSSLYMVEGYVQASNVTFQKFNTSFVPIQAMVQLSVYAQHVGFAKETTFLTHTLKAAEDAEIDYNAQVTTTAIKNMEAAKAELTSWDLALTDTVYGIRLTPAGFVNPRKFQVDANFTSSSLKEVRALFQGNSSLKITYGMKLYVDMKTERAPTGSEGTSPIVNWQSNTHVHSTAGEVKVMEKRNPNIRPNAAEQNNQPSTETIIDSGGYMKAVWTMTVELIADGVKAVGTARHTDFLSGIGLDGWLAPLTANMNLSWRDFGDPDSTEPYVDPRSVEDSGTPTVIDLEKDLE